MFGGERRYIVAAMIAFDYYMTPPLSRGFYAGVWGVSPLVGVISSASMITKLGVCFYADVFTHQSQLL